MGRKCEPLLSETLGAVIWPVEGWVGDVQRGRVVERGKGVLKPGDVLRGRHI